MTDETAAAFGSLDRRAAAQPDQPTAPDRISVRDHVVEVEIGAFQSERDTTQRLSFSVVVEVARAMGRRPMTSMTSCPMTQSPKQSRSSLRRNV